MGGGGWVGGGEIAGGQGGRNSLYVCSARVFYVYAPPPC
jgi:hypothetical protein